MARLLLLFLILWSGMLVTAQSTIQDSVKLTYIPSIPWQPYTYVCQQPIDEIRVDGLDNEESWKSLGWSDDFIDIEGRVNLNPSNSTNMKMLWDEEYLYLYAKLEEPHIWATRTNRDTVIYQDDCFEIFIDPDGDAHNYYEFQVNAFNTIWDLFVLWPYREKQGPNYLTQWDARGIRHAVNLEGTLNNAADIDTYWAVEMAIPWSAIQEMAPRRKAPRSNDQWRMNFARVDWPMKIINGDYEKLLQDNGLPMPENYAAWSPHGTVAMHMPEWWGYVQFSDTDVQQPTPKFIAKPDEEIKWALWQLYYQQKEFYEKTHQYAKSMEQFTVPVVKTCSFEPTLFSGDFGFQFSAPSCNGKSVWIINEMGRVNY